MPANDSLIEEFPDVAPAPASGIEEFPDEPSPDYPVLSPGYSTEVARGLTQWVPALAKTTSTVGDKLGNLVRAGVGLGPLPETLVPPEERPLYKAGEWMRRKLDDAYPAVPEAERNIGHDVAQGLGQMGSMVAGGVGARAAGASIKGAGWLATVLGSVQEFDDAFSRSRQRGDDPDTAFAKSLGYATVAGLIENKLGAGRILQKYFPDPALAAQKLSAWGVSKAVAGSLAVGFGEEGSQRFAQNWIVEGKPSLEGVVQEGAPGGIVQAIAELPATLLRAQGGRIRRPKLYAQPETEEQNARIEASGEVQKPAAALSQGQRVAATEVAPRILVRAMWETPRQFEARREEYARTGIVPEPPSKLPDIAIPVEAEVARQKLWENMAGREMDIPRDQWEQPASPHLKMVLGDNAPSWRDLNFQGVVTANKNPDGSYRVKLITRAAQTGLPENIGGTLGVASENLPPDSQAIEAANKAKQIKIFAEASGVPYVEGDTGAMIQAKIKAKAASVNAPKEAAGVQLTDVSVGTTPAAVEPWQMRKSEGDKWVDANMINAVKTDKGRIIARNTEHGDLMPAMEEAGSTFKNPNARGWALVGRKPSESYIGIFDVNEAKGDFHKAYVMKALREGKPVPQSVLSDYSDLAASAEGKPEVLSDYPDLNFETKPTAKPDQLLPFVRRQSDGYLVGLKNFSTYAVTNTKLYPTDDEADRAMKYLRNTGDHPPFKKAGYPSDEPKPAPSASETKLAAIRAKREEIKARLRKKLGGQTNIGVDPEVAIIAAELAVNYTQEGVVRFSDFARKVKAELPDIWDALKQYLRGAWTTVADASDNLDDQNEHLQRTLNLDIEHNDDGTPVVRRDLARTFTGRMSRMPDDWQKNAYSEIIPAYRQMIEQLKANGEYDLEVIVHSDWDGVRKSDQELSAGTDDSNIFTASVRMQEWEVSDRRHVPSGAEMQADLAKNLGDRQKANEEFSIFSSKVRDRLQGKKQALESERNKIQSKPIDQKSPDVARLVKIEQEINSVDAAIARWEQTESSVSDVIRRTGQLVTLTNNETGDTYDAMLTDVRYPKGNGAAPSGFQFKFMTDAPGGLAYVSGSQLGPDKWTVDGSQREISDLKGGRRDQRFERYLVTGNPIRAYTATGGRGKMVRFISREGQTITGLLMPRNWGPENLANDPRLDLANGKAVAHYLLNYTSQRNPEPVESAGQVSISRSRIGYNSYTVRTGAAKRAGGSIFLDKKLIKITGDFTKVGNRMEATIDEADVAKAADAIREITKSPFRPSGKAEDLMPNVIQSNNQSRGKANPESYFSKADELAAKLENLKTGIGEGGQLHAFGIVADLWDRAVSIAQGIIRAGGTIADAIEAAIRHIKSKHTGEFDEQVAREELGVVASLEPTGDARAREEEGDKVITQVQGVRVGIERDAENIADIQATIRRDIFDGTRAVTEAATGDARALFGRMTDPNQKAGAAGEILTKTNAQMGPGLVLAELWNYANRMVLTGGDDSFLREIVPHYQDFDLGGGGSTAFGRGLRALQEGGPLFKQLWEIEKEARAAAGQKMAVGPELLDVLIERMKGAIPEAAAVQAEFDAQAQRRAPTGAVRVPRNLKSLIESIRNSPYLSQSDPAWRYETAIKWFQASGMDAEQADQATVSFTAAFDKAFAAALEREARAVLGKKTSPNKIEEIVRAIRAGVTDPARALLNHFATLAGFKPATPAQHARLAELDQKLADQDLSPPERAQVVEQMDSIFRHMTLPPSLLTKLSANFVATLLTGFKTFTVNIFAPPVRLLTERVALSFTNPRDFTTHWKSLAGAWSNWIREAQLTATDDVVSFLNNDYRGANNVLKRMWEDGVADMRSGDPKRQATGLWQLMSGAQQYSMRMLNAADQANMITEREAMLALYGSAVLRRAGLGTREVQIMVQAMSRIKRELIQDGLGKGMKPSLARVRADALLADKLQQFVNGEISEQAGDEFFEAMHASELDAYSSTGRLGMTDGGDQMKETDEGGVLSRVILHHVLEWSSKMRSKPGSGPAVAVALLGYLNIPLRTARFYAWNAPFYGLFRMGIHKFRKYKGWDNWWKQTLATEVQERHRMKMAVASTVAFSIVTGVGLALAKTSADDDAGEDELGVYITGDGPKNKNLKDAWTRRGFQQQSIVMFLNKKPIRVPLTRLGEPLAHILWFLSARDDWQWRKKEAEAAGRPFKEPPSETVMRGIGTYAGLLGQRGPLQNISQWARLGSGEGGTTRLLAAQTTRLASAAVTPFLGLQNSISSMIYGPIENASLEAAIYSNLPVLGFFGEKFRKQQVNRFGDPLYDQSWYAKMSQTGIPIAFRVSDTLDNKMAYSLLTEKGAAPPVLRRYIVEEKYGPLTNDQYEQFAEKSGRFLKQQLIRAEPSLRAMPPESVKKWLNKTTASADKQAAVEMNLEPVKPTRSAAGGPISEPRQLAQNPRISAAAQWRSGRAPSVPTYRPVSFGRSRTKRPAFRSYATRGRTRIRRPRLLASRSRIRRPRFYGPRVRRARLSV